MSRANQLALGYGNLRVTSCDVRSAFVDPVTNVVKASTFEVTSISARDARSLLLQSAGTGNAAAALASVAQAETVAVAAEPETE